MLLEQERVKEFQRKVFSFYQSSGRSLPWRQTTDRYAILVSEIMLQQTQVDRVVEKYHAWLEAFPTLEHLAGASFQDVLGLWKGLGYNSRARRLQESAQKIMTYFQGNFLLLQKKCCYYLGLEDILLILF